jgi:F-box/TPR repeat protein Pof3
MSPEECVELGRRYYSLKQYEKALEIFSIGIKTSPSLSLYDHRAACYDRLEKQDVKGYLRTASILQKMDKPDTALGIYKYGMKNVPVSDKNFKV